MLDKKWVKAIWYEFSILQENFNGYIVRKMGTFRYYPQPLKYKLIQGLKKLLKRS